MRPRGWAAAAAIVALVVLGWLVWSLFAIPPRLPALGDATPAQLAEGAKTYATHCAACHGANLEGQPDWRTRGADGRLPAPPHDATGHTWHHSDKKLFELTKYGLVGLAGDDYKTRMPAYDGILSDRDIIAVLSFIKSRWPANIRKRHDRLNSARRR